MAVRGGVRASVPSCLIEARQRCDDGPNMPPGALQATAASPPRFGFTVTKKLGNAVARNRIRRRLKAAIASVAAHHAETGYDYVVVARSAAFDRAYGDMIADLVQAFAILHAPRRSSRPQRTKNRTEKRQP